MDEIEYDWEVLEVLRELPQRGAQVRYTPVDAELPTIEKFVPIPWHKCQDADHAKEVCERKVNAYAPAAQWRKAQAGAQPDQSDTFIEDLQNDRPRGTKRIPDPERSDDDATVSGQSSGAGDRE